MTTMRALMEKLRLTVNETKTRVCRLPEDTFDLLGYTFGRLYVPQTGKAHLGPKSAKQKVQSICTEISRMTDRRTTGKDVGEVVTALNRKLRGWSNYFRVGTVVHSREFVTKHVRRRLRRWLCSKHKVRGSGHARFSNATLHEELGLLQFPGVRHGLP